MGHFYHNNKALCKIHGNKIREPPPQKKCNQRPNTKVVLLFVCKDAHQRAEEEISSAIVASVINCDACIVTVPGFF